MQEKLSIKKVRFCLFDDFLLFGQPAADDIRLFVFLGRFAGV